MRRDGGARRVRGSLGFWTTEDKVDGAVRTHNGADAVVQAVIDGGHSLEPTPPTRRPRRGRGRR